MTVSSHEAQVDLEAATHKDGYNIVPLDQTEVEMTVLGSDRPSDASTAKEEILRTRYRSATFSPWVPDNSPFVLVWQDLCVSTRTSTPKQILNNLSGTITGGFWAIMGSSGSGKTTFLSTVSLRLDTAKMNISGDMRINGRPYDKNVLKSMTAYVMQDDLLHAELTVEETLTYAARLRLAGVCEEDEQQDRVDEVIELMGINHVRDVMIGDVTRKGISGGERKRVCVAMELLSRPKCLFLDEPTSGLDSSTALSVVTALKNLTNKGICTVICTIHQPQVRIFNLFDNLVLMNKGLIVYQGSCAKSILFLETLGKPCPAGVNPADHLIESIITPGDKFDNTKNQIVPIDLTLGIDKDFTSKDFDLGIWMTQFKVLFQRCFKQYLRRTDIILLNFISTAVIALFVGLGIWRDIGTTQLSVKTRIPSLFFGCVTQGIYASLQCVSSFPTERAISLRERAAGAYYVSSYFLAKTCVDIITQSWGPTMFAAIAYPLIGYQNVTRKWFIYWAFMLLDAFSALSLATMISCFCVTIDLSTVVLSVMLELSRLYGGFFTSPALLEQHPHWKFADAMSYLKYTFVGVALNELTDLELTCTPAEIAKKSCVHSGEQLIQTNHYDEYTIPFCAGMLLIYILVCRVLAYGALRYYNK